jgi:hypothetical protein
MTSAELISTQQSLSSQSRAHQRHTHRLPSGKLSSISLLFSLNSCGLVLELSSTGILH